MQISNSVQYITIYVTSINNCIHLFLSPDDQIYTEFNINMFYNTVPAIGLSHALKQNAYIQNTP